MQNEQQVSQILDLTDKQTLFELAVEEDELLGREGAQLLAELKERAIDAEYTHMYFRDPIRPGIIWFTILNAEGSTLPTRGKLEQSRAIVEKIFPDFLSRLDPENDEQIMNQIPPLSPGASGLELVTALEYISFVYPAMTRAWAALIFAYGELLKLRESAESVRMDCIGTCPHAQVVTYLIDGFEGST